MLADVREGYITVERVADVYGVVLTGDHERFETLRVDHAATLDRRRAMLPAGRH